MDVIKSADWIIDLGPEGGDGGGEVVALGTPEQIAAHATSYTGAYIAPVAGRRRPGGADRWPIERPYRGAALPQTCARARFGGHLSERPPAVLAADQANRQSRTDTALAVFLRLNHSPVMSRSIQRP